MNFSAHCETGIDTRAMRQRELKLLKLQTSLMPSAPANQGSFHLLDTGYYHRLSELVIAKEQLMTLANVNVAALVGKRA